MANPRRIHIKKKEKQARQWLEELYSLYETRRKNSKIQELKPPIFRGYLVNFVITPYGKKTLSSEIKKLFNKKSPTFFSTNKEYVKNLNPDPHVVFTGSNFSDPDLEETTISTYRPFWPIVFYREKPRNMSTTYINPEEVTERFWFYDKGVWIYKLPKKAFRVKISKYHQKLIYVESAEIDSRIDYLRKKLFDEKNYFKYIKEYSDRNYWANPPISLYYQDISGISPSKPYKRNRFKIATNKLIQKK